MAADNNTKSSIFFITLCKDLFKMKLINILTPLLSLLLVGCGVKRDCSILDQAERLIYQHPDSAYMLLSPIKLDDMGDEQSRARFALLYTMALDSKGIEVKRDSLTSVALEYYKDHGSEYQRASAYLYAAKIDYQWRDIPEVVEKLTHAQDIAPSDSLYLQCMISNYIGYCYSYQFDHKRAIKSFEKVYSLALQLDDKPIQAKVLTDIYSEYARLKSHENALGYIQSSRAIYYELQDSVNMLRSEGRLATSRVRNGESAARVREEYLRRRSNFRNQPIGTSEHMILAELYSRSGMIDSASYHIGQATMNTPRSLKERVALHQRVVKMHTLTGRYKEAYSALMKVNEYQERFYKESIGSATSKLAERYKSEIYREQTLTLESEKRGIIYISIAIFSLLLALLYLLIRRYKSRLRRMDEQLGMAQDLAQAITNSQAMMSDSEDDSLGNINFMMSRLNHLIEKMPKYESNPHGFITEFVTLMRREKVDSKTIFSQIIDREYNGVLSIIESRYSLDSNEIEILSMVALGVSNNAMRIILDHTNNRTIYNLRSSIKSKLNIPIDSRSVLELLSREGEQIS